MRRTSSVCSVNQSIEANEALINRAHCQREHRAILIVCLLGRTEKRKQKPGRKDCDDNEAAVGLPLLLAVWCAPGSATLVVYISIVTATSNKSVSTTRDDR